MTTVSYSCPLAHSETDVQRLLRDTIDRERAYSSARDALRAALERMRQDALTIHRLREQLSACRAELRGHS